MDRQQATGKFRWRLLVRDGFRCIYCGRGRTDTTHSDLELHIDHVVPLSKGGEFSPNNLAVACSKCNLSKNNNPLPPKILAQVQRLVKRRNAGVFDDWRPPSPRPSHPVRPKIRPPKVGSNDGGYFLELWFDVHDKDPPLHMVHWQDETAREILSTYKKNQGEG